MAQVKEDLLYAKTHEWLQVDGEFALIGITDYAQSMLGDLVFVELPEVGATFNAGDELGVVESVKSASDIYTPIACTVTEVNSELDTQPELINQSPYEQGWIVKVSISAPDELKQLLPASDYQKTL